MDDAYAAADTAAGAHCSLSPEALDTRLDDWREVMRSALRREQPRDGLTVAHYPRDVALRARIDELIAAESTCCPFLRFEVTETDEELRVALEHPPEFNLLAAR
jgi:hypothetical protein